MAEEKRDLLDDIIGIRKDWKAVQSPLDNVTTAITAKPDEIGTWNPSDYKERPRANPLRCVRCTSEDGSACSRCVDVCPVGAITIHGGKVEIGEGCRKCGLCLSACPNEVFTDRTHLPKRLYDAIAKVASSHNECYLTCTRALGRTPRDNEVVLPCVGALPDELLFSVVADFPNVSVYLPFGICDRCRTTTGERTYVEAIGTAEEWTGRAVGLEMEEESLGHELKRSYERSEFVKSALRTGASAAATAASPVLSGAAAITKSISDHTKQINALEGELDKMVGATTSQKHRRSLTQRRQLLLATVQKRPKLASRITLEVPACDASRCTMCGACTKACPFNAIDLDASGHVSVAAAYCTGCGACYKVCPESALTKRPVTADELVVPDEDAARRKEREEEQKQEIERLKAEGRARLKKGLDMLEHLADEPEE